MITAILTLTLGASQVPGTAAVPAAIQHARIPASVQISETHFLAQSYTPEAQWIVFENELSGLRTMRGLGPFESLLYPIVRGGTAGMTIQIVSTDEFGLPCSTGTFACESLTGQTLFIELSGEEQTGWIARHGGRSLTRASGASRTLATHIPVPLPSENKKKDKSRRIEKSKLPPF